MRHSDRERLKTPYQGTVDADIARRNLFEAFDVRLPSVQQLASTILNDLDPKVYGVRWWAEYSELGDKRRIFISDYLYQVADSLADNLLQARCHALELRGALDQKETELVDAVRLTEQGKMTVEHPIPKSAADDLPDLERDMHLAGFFRALGSAADCLGAVIVGVAALPVDIKKASFVAALDALEGMCGDSPGATAHIGIKKSIAQHRHSAGPEGWLRWALQYRNTLVHRARRLGLTTLVVRSVDNHRGQNLVKPSGTPLLITRPVPMPPFDPDRSDVEMWMDDDNLPILTEHVITTVDGLAASMFAFVEAVTKDLEALWISRRTTPDLLVQPRVQWPLRSVPTSRFRGYSPGQVEYKPGSASMNPTTVSRMRAAGLDGDERKERWRNFT